MAQWIKSAIGLLAVLIGSSAGSVAAAPCLRLAGVVQDYISHQPLAARLYLKTATGRAELGSSAAATGRFAVGISCPAVALIIERPGYRSQMLRLNLPVTASGNEPVEIVIPLIAVDPLERDKPYLQTEQTHYEQTSTGSTGIQPQRNVFLITDALSGKVLVAKTCFFFTSNGQKRCIDANEAGQFSLDFTRKDIVAMEVTAPGYQTYQGNLIVDELDGRQLRHTIRLTRELTVLSVRLDAPAASCELYASTTGKVTVLASGQRNTFVASGLVPQTYKLTILEPNRAIREQRTLVLRNGLNFVRSVARQSVVSPVSNPVLTAPPDRSVNPDSLSVLYFDQSSFLIPPSSKATLKQIAVYLLQHPELKLRLAGHTDREGDEHLNRYLAENRAKVVSSFLYGQGISDERMEVVGYGSRYPVAPSDKEENKAKNRRVQLTLIPNLK